MMTPGPSDRELLHSAHEGADDAAARLRDRHLSALLRAARLFVGDEVAAAALAEESLAEVLAAVRRSGPPSEPLRACLLRTLARRAQAADGAGGAAGPTGVGGVPAAAGTGVAGAGEALEEHPALLAFEQLTPPQREILWYVDVERVSREEAGAILGLAPAPAASQARRAREALGREYVHLHLRRHPEGTECWAVLSRLGRYVRGSVSRAQRRRVDRHLRSCTSCALALVELTTIGATLRAVLGPLVLGPAALGYLAGPEPSGTAGSKPVAGRALGLWEGAGLLARLRTGGGAVVRGPVAGASGRLAVIGAIPLTVAAAAVIAGLGAMATVSPGRVGAAPGTLNALRSDRLVSAVPPPPAARSDDLAGEADGRRMGLPGSSRLGGSTAGLPGGDRLSALGAASSAGAAAASAGRSPGSGGSAPGSAPSTGPGQSPVPDRQHPPSPAPPDSPAPDSPAPDSPAPDSPAPSESPAPQPSGKPQHRTPDQPPASEFTVTAWQLTSTTWERGDGHHYVVVDTTGLQPYATVTMRITGPALTQMSGPAGSVPPAPPVTSDDSWDCSPVGLLIPNGYDCVGQADSVGESRAVVGSTALISTAYPVQVEIGSGELSASAEVTVTPTPTS